MRPRAVVRHIKVIAAGFRLETGRAVGGYKIAKARLQALERAALIRVPDILINPFAVDQLTHRTVPL